MKTVMLVGKRGPAFESDSGFKIVKVQYADEKRGIIYNSETNLSPKSVSKGPDVYKNTLNRRLAVAKSLADGTHDLSITPRPLRD